MKSLFLFVIISAASAAVSRVRRQDSPHVELSELTTVSGSDRNTATSTNIHFVRPTTGNAFTDAGILHISEEPATTEFISSTFENFPEETTPKESEVDLNSLIRVGQPNRPPAFGLGNRDECECVPYYQCREGYIVTDGSGLIDIRFGATLNDTQPGVINSNSQCSGFLDVCCSLKEKTTTPVPPYQSKCGRRNRGGVHARVTGFKEDQAQFGEFPWMAAILRKEQIGKSEINLYVCGGSLIYPNVVLTAAHCVVPWQKDPSNLRVRLGEWDTQNEYELYAHQDRDVIAVIIHKGYVSGPLWNDIALVVLAEPAELAPNVDVICLPEYNFTEYEHCIATGWGKNFFGAKGVYQNVLKLIELPTVPNPECERKLKSTRLGVHFSLHSSFMCAGGEPDKDTCKGDGGSPFVCAFQHPNGELTYKQVGIVAWGIGCGEAGIPGVYVDVRKFLPWIYEKLVELGAVLSNG